MRTLRRAALALCCTVPLGCAVNAPPTATKPAPSAPPPATTPTPTGVELQVVKLPQWREALAAQKGKVVLVDVWATFCTPCMAKFPHLVELHEKYAKDGLACVSLSVDPVEDKDQALAFLKKKNAAFPNYLIDETTDEWQTKLDIGNPPVALVFDRDGKLVKKFATDTDGQYTFEEVEKVFLPLLKK